MLLIQLNLEWQFSHISLSVLEGWVLACTQEGINLSKSALTEFKKKIKEAGLVGSAAHLDLRNGSLNARQVAPLRNSSYSVQTNRAFPSFRFLCLFSYYRRSLLFRVLKFGPRT